MQTLNNIQQVQNFQSSNGNNVPNQFEIFTADGKFFKSYNSIIAFKANDGSIFLDSKYWNYSKTTGRYRNAFLGENQKETQKKIDAGVYTLVNLNK